LTIARKAKEDKKTEKDVHWQTEKTNATKKRVSHRYIMYARNALSNKLNGENERQERGREGLYKRYKKTPWNKDAGIYTHLPPKQGPEQQSLEVLHASNNVAQHL